MRTEVETQFFKISGKKYDTVMSRCYNENNKSFHRYGGRGLRVCASLIASIDIFRNWISEQLIILNVSKEFYVLNSRNMQIDRIDNDGNYTPENCRIVNAQSNMRNQKGHKRQFMSAEGYIVSV